MEKNLDFDKEAFKLFLLSHEMEKVYNETAGEDKEKTLAAFLYVARKCIHRIENLIRAILSKKNKFILINSDPAEARHIATEAAESNAPPTAPPDFNVVKSTLEAILPSIFVEMADTDTTPTQIFRHLDQPEIRNYIIDKISCKAYAYPNLLPLSWASAVEFLKFQKSIKGEIYRLLLTILKNRNARKAAPILVFARESLNRHEVSIDATLPCAGDGEKAISYHDIIADPAGDPLSMLIARENYAVEQAAIAALSSADKARLVSEFDEKNKIKNGALFCVDNDYETEPEAAEKQLNLEKYRQKNKSKSPRQRQLELFAVAGGAI